MDEGTFHETFTIALRNFRQDNPGVAVGGAELIRDVWHIKSQKPGTLTLNMNGSMATLADGIHNWKTVSTRQELFSLIGTGCHMKLHEGGDPRLGWEELWYATLDGLFVARISGDPLTLPDFGKHNGKKA